MRIVDTSGTHTFLIETVSDINDFGTISRDVTYKNIALHNSSVSIGTDKVITFDFFQLDRTKLTELNTIFTTNKGDNSSIALITNVDEVITGETYLELVGATNGIYIDTKQWKQKKSIQSKDIQFWNTRLTFRFDTVVTKTK